MTKEFTTRLRTALEKAVATGTLDDYATHVGAAFLVTGILEGDINLLAPQLGTYGVPYWAPWTMRWVINTGNKDHMANARDILRHLEHELGITYHDP